MSSAGDVNGDGFDDLIIGAQLADGSGNAQLRRRQLRGVRQGVGLCAAIDLADARRRHRRLRHPRRRTRATSPAFRCPRPATSTAMASTTSSSGPMPAPVPGNAQLCRRQLRGVRPAGGLRGDDRSRRVAAAPAASSSTARTRTITPAVRCPRPATSMATASTTSSSGRHAADGPGNATRDAAGDSYVVFGKRGGFGPTIDLVASRPARRLRDPRRRTRTTTPAFRCPRPVTSTATASTTSSSGRASATAPAHRAHDAGDSYVLFGSATIGGSVNHVTHAGHRRRPRP